MIHLELTDLNHSVNSPAYSRDRSRDSSQSVTTPKQRRLDKTDIPALCDERLRDIDIAFWTDVTVTNQEAADIISLALQIEHPLVGAFDANLMISDLVAKRTRFCSPLLVSAIMYWASRCYQPFDSVIPLAGFREESLERWSQLGEHKDINTVAAGLCMHIAHAGARAIVL